MPNKKHSKKWVIKPEIDDGFKAKHKEIEPMHLQLLFNRGLKDKTEFDRFLYSANIEDLHDPFLFQDMDASVDLIISHIKKNDEIIVYGDYDADGVTASALLTEVIRILNGKVDVYLPDRINEGYGINERAIMNFHKKGVKLIITVDNGIRQAKEAELTKKLGIDLIITDHHTPPEKLPDALIINPKVNSDKYPFYSLAGVGVAFKLAQAIVSKAKLSDEIKDKIIDRSLDLVAIGTVADCVPLTGENKLLTKIGLNVLNKRKRIGVNELINSANCDGKIDSWHIGWIIAPRLNSAGRLKHANTSFELLLAKNKEKAKEISAELNNNNIQRQEITESIVKEIEEQIKAEISEKRMSIIIAQCSEDKNYWQEGVIGLAAGRLCEKYYLPALVITGSNGEYKGSGRSIDEFDVTAALEQAKENLFKFGGHKAACGFSIIGKENLNKFKKNISTIAEKQLAGIELSPKVEIEAVLKLVDINEDLLEFIDLLGPFGEGNPKPVFISKDVVILDIMNLGQDNKHLKLRLKDDNSRVFSALGFNQAEVFSNLKIGDKIDIVYCLDLNKFNGREEIQLKIIDLTIC